MASSAEDAGEGGSPQATVLSALALSRRRMRPSFMQGPDPRAFRQYLRTSAHPPLSSGEHSRKGARHLAFSRLDRARLALRPLGIAADQRSLSRKELVSLQHNRRAVRYLRDDLWRWGIGEVKKTAEQRDWGDVAYEVARALVECQRNRSDTRFDVARLWDLWPLPLQQLEQTWDEMHVDAFPEVSDNFARPGDLKWDTFYTVFSKQWLTNPSPYMKPALGLPDIPASASPLPVCPNPAEQLDSSIRALGGRVSLEPSLERPFARRKRTLAEVLVAPRPEPVRREARIRKPSRRSLPSPALPEEEVVMKPPEPPKPGNELEQLQGLLTLCSDLSKEVAKPDAEWVRELLQQIRTEFERQRREQRKVLQQLIAGIKELMEQIARRARPEEPAAKRARPVSVELYSDDDEGSEVRPTALRVAEASGALDIFVGVPMAELAEARSTPRATESVEASEEAPPMKSPSQPHSVAPSPSPTAEVRLAGEPTPVSIVSAAPRLRAVAEEVPSVQRAVRQLLAIFADARQLRPDVGRRDSVHLEDAPHDHRGRPAHEEFMPALWGEVRRSSLRAVRLGRTPKL